VPCWKLVRDGVAREVAGSGDVVVLRFSGDALERLLRVKIVEEALELAEGGGLEEAADLYEALSEWLRVRGFSWDDLLRVAGEKRARRGGFSGGFVVVWLGRDSC
jgi:predicted house-cleaning noncanonical NTP pyrophosphatase (MazG superfamily)